MAEITSSGFERENYSDLLDTIKQRFKNEFGNDVALTDSDPMGQFAAILAKLQNDNLKLLEALWASRKLAGAEGVYLDDIFGRAGIYRRGRQKGTGTVLLETDETTPNNFLFPVTTNISAANGKTYNPQQDTLLINNVSAFKLDRADIQLGQQYDVTLTDTTDSTQYLFTYTPAVDADRDTMLNSLSSFWESHTTGNEQSIYVSGGVLYIGYDPSDNSLAGISESTEFTITPVVGVRHSSVSVICTERGYNPVSPNKVTGINPTFTGFVSISNPTSFFPGSEVESDAEYRARYFQEIKETKGGTRDSVVAACLAVEGVSKVRIYDNPTVTSRPEADARSFNTVILGGSAAELSKALYDAKPINAGTSGTTAFAIGTADGTTEIIRHTRATQTPLDVRINYSTKDGIPLSDVEKTSISTEISNYVSSINIGEILYNARLIFSALSASGASRIVTITIETKRQSDAVNLYTNADFTPEFDEIYTITTNDLTYSQVI